MERPAAEQSRGEKRSQGAEGGREKDAAPGEEEAEHGGQGPSAREEQRGALGHSDDGSRTTDKKQRRNIRARTVKDCRQE